jgi:SSS family solute:Na+ symporter
MGLGFTTGLAWYQLGGWQPDQFYLGIHPVWAGMAINLAAMVTITLIESHGACTTAPAGPRRTRGLWTLTGAVALGVATLSVWTWLQARGLGGLSGFATVTLAAAALFQLLGPTTAAVLPQDQHQTTGEALQHGRDEDSRNRGHEAASVETPTSA